MSVILNASSFPLLSSVDAGTKPIVAVKINPAGLEDGAARRPFHLALLLDVSGSMDGERIEALRRTMNLLVDALRDADILTIITYNSAANIRADCVAINTESRVTLHTTIDNLIADGGTNMEAAIGTLRVLAADPAKPNVDSVFILTDGHINAGMTSSAGLLRLLQNQMNQGVPINTLGYGADHNSRLLRDMAIRSHGTYTFADADEVLPAIIGDIMGGLESEIGRQAKLTIPPGWTCLELQTLVNNEYCIGTLIAEKPQWIVLEGEAGTTSLPPLTLSWIDADGKAVSTMAGLDSVIPMLEVVEQRERCRVAAVFSAVTEDVEAYRLDVARTKLQELTAELGTSPAKDSTFVIRLQAQVEDMIESLRPVDTSPPAPRGLGRAPLWPVGEPGPAPSIAPVVSRLASNTTVLVNQRGIISGAGTSGTSGGAGVPAARNPMLHAALFSSPSQRSASNRMTHAYTESAATATESP
jgi:uncharacterized protein YegL